MASNRKVLPPKFPHLVYPEEGRINPTYNPDNYPLLKLPSDLTKLTSGFYAITPEIAKQILAKHSNPANNIRTKERWRDELTGRMNDGEWSLMDTIEFDILGILTNGHHRLASCAASNAIILVNVVFGTSPENYYKYDDNLKREMAQIISEHFNVRKDEGAVIAPATTHIYLYCIGASLESRRYINKKTRLEVVKATGLNNKLVTTQPGQPEIITNLRSIRSMAKTAKVTKLPVQESVLLTLYTLGCGINKTKTREFIKGVITGEMLTTNNPAHLYREWLRANASSATQRTYTSLKIVKGLVALRAYLDGVTKLTRLYTPKSGVPRLSVEHEQRFADLAAQAAEAEISKAKTLVTKAAAAASAAAAV
jgi:hypothetical protein